MKQHGVSRLQASMVAADNTVLSPFDKDLPELLLHELWTASNADASELGPAEFGEILIFIGTRHSYAVAPGTEITPRHREVFWRGLHLADLALARACARGSDAAWKIFVTRYRDLLERSAIAITGSSSLGNELADSIYSELFGLTERDGRRRSPLESYSGRGSLAGWLRTTLSQRYVDHYRQTKHQTPIEDRDFPSPVPVDETSPAVIDKLSKAVALAMRELSAEDRFLLSSYFLDQRTLQQIGSLLQVHEATVSRRLKRLTDGLHKRLLKHLQACGMSKRAAQEALGTDPRDLDLNLRILLQDFHPPPFQRKEDTANGA